MRTKAIGLVIVSTTLIAASQPEQSGETAAAPSETVAPAAEKAIDTQAKSAEKPEVVTTKAAAPVAGQAPAAPDSEGVMIDTIDLAEPKGNWLLKRKWWEEAEKIYEKIRHEVDQIFDDRMIFHSKCAELDREVLAPFYQNAGVSEGVLQEVLESLTTELDKDISADTERERRLERDVIRKVRQEKEQFEQLKKDVETIVGFDQSIKQVQVTLREQINNARSFERQAWINFKNIARELSDKTAYELYYAMKSFLNDVRKIHEYEQGPLTEHLNQLVTSVKDKTHAVQKSIQELKTRGIDLKAEADRIEAQIRGESCKVEEHKPEEHEEIAEGFFSRLVRIVSLPFTYLFKAFSYVGSFFSNAFDGVRSLFGSGPSADEEENEEQY